MSNCLCSSAVLGAAVRRLMWKPNPVTFQPVRWRMRRWEPINESKLFYVRKKSNRDPVEQLEIRPAYRLYKTHMKSIKYHFRELLLKPKSSTDEQADVQEQQVVDRIIKLNQAWNEQTRIQREARQAKEEQDRVDQQLRVLMEMEQKEEQQKARSRGLVKLEEQAMQTFIDPDNLDEELEKALNTRCLYNYVIDTEGNLYKEESDGSLAVGQQPDDVEQDKLREYLNQQYPKPASKATEPRKPRRRRKRVEQTR